MVTQEKTKEFFDKITTKSLSAADIPTYLAVFAAVCNADDSSKRKSIKKEVEGWDRTFQFKIGDNLKVWLMFNGGTFTAGDGDAESAEITLEMSAEIGAKIFNEKADMTAAYMSGDLKVVGPIPDLVKFRTIMEKVQDALKIADSGTIMQLIDITTKSSSTAEGINRPDLGKDLKKMSKDQLRAYARELGGQPTTNLNIEELIKLIKRRQFEIYREEHSRSKDNNIPKAKGIEIKTREEVSNTPKLASFDQKIRIFGMIQSRRRVDLAAAAEFVGMAKKDIEGLIYDLVGEGKLAGEWDGEVFLITSDVDAAVRALKAGFDGWKDKKA